MNLAKQYGLTDFRYELEFARFYKMQGKLQDSKEHYKKALSNTPMLTNLDFKTTLPFSYNSKSSVFIKGDILIISTDNGVCSINKNNGEIFWDITVNNLSDMTENEDKIFICTLNGELLEINIFSGQMKKHLSESKIYRSLVYNPSSNTLGIITGDSFLDLDKSQEFILYDLNKRRKISDIKIQGTTGTDPVNYYDKVIFGSSLGYIYCINSKSGIIEWKLDANKTLYYKYYSNRSRRTNLFFDSYDLALQSNVIVFGGYNSMINYVNIANGEIIGQKYVPSGMWSTPLFINNLLIFANANGEIVAYDKLNEFKWKCYVGIKNELDSDELKNEINKADETYYATLAERLIISFYGNILYVNNENVLLNIDITTGQINWVLKLPGSPCDNMPLDNQKIYILSFKQQNQSILFGLNHSSNSILTSNISFELGELLYNLNEFDSAQSLLENSIIQNPYNKDAFIYLSKIAYKQNKVSNAVRYLFDYKSMAWLESEKSVVDSLLAAISPFKYSLKIGPNLLNPMIDSIIIIESFGEIMRGKKNQLEQIWLLPDKYYLQEDSKYLLLCNYFLKC